MLYSQAERQSSIPDAVKKAKVRILGKMEKDAERY